MKNWLSLLISVVFISFLSNAFGQERKNFTLRETLQTARNNNPLLKSERLNIDIAKTEVTSAKLRPNLSFRTEIIQQTDPNAFENHSGWYKGANREEQWELSKPIQIAGLRKNKIEFADKSVTIEEQNYLEFENEFLNQVAVKWLETDLVRKKTEIYEKTHAKVDSLIQLSKSETKVISKRESLQSEILASQFNLEYKSARIEHNQNQNELKHLLQVDFLIETVVSDDFSTIISHDIDELYELALSNRPDLKATKILFDVSETNIRLQKSLAIPQPEIGVIYTPKNNVSFLGFSASFDIPFFDRNQAERQKSQIEKNQVEQEITLLENQIKTEVASAYETFLLQNENFNDLQKLRINSKELLTELQNDFQKGDINLPDFLEELRAWMEIEIQYFETEKEFKESYISLLQNLGMINELSS